MEYVTHKELAKTEDKINGKIDRSLAEQNDYRHNLANTVTTQFARLEEKIESLLILTTKNESNIANMTKTLSDHMKQEDKDRQSLDQSLKDLKKDSGSKLTEKMFWKYATIAAVAGGTIITGIITFTIYLFLQNDELKSDVGDVKTEIRVMDEKLNNTEQNTSKILDTLGQYNFEFTN